MDDKNFEKADRSFMTALKGLREKPSDGGYGIAAEVERRLRAGGSAPRARRARALPWLVPALALSLVVAVVPALRPVHVTQGPVAERIQLASRPTVSSVDDEIAILKEVGAWTEDDDNRVAPETEYEEVELSRAVPLTRIV